MKTFNNLSLYKKALHHVEKLGKLEAIMKESIQKLEEHRKYIPAQECLEILNNNLVIVSVHLQHQKKIVENKGKE